MLLNEFNVQVSVSGWFMGVFVQHEPRNLLPPPEFTFAPEPLKE
jgi:hypothetical protein